MLGAIYIGLSGMKAYSQGLQTISNNVGNMNTLGFKSTSVTFTDLYSYGGGGMGYLGSSTTGSGTRVATPLVDFSQGDLRQTENDLDLAIQGSGFFVLLDGDKTYYTRTGQFVVDEDGFISQQGTDDHLAVINDDGRAVELNIDSKRVSAPQATTTVTFADNLSSSSTTASVSDVVVYDSAGGKHVWSVQFAKGETQAGATTDWTVTVKDENSNIVGTSKLSFIGSIVDPATSKLTIEATSTNAPPISVVFDFSSGVTSYSGGTTSTLRAAKTDGRAVGALSGVTANSDGQIELAWTNGDTEVAGAIAVADFRDPQQLQSIGSGRYVYSGTGQKRVSSSGVDGTGTIVSKQLEASNVDLSQEFGDLILIQRGFQASSQVVSVSNDMIQQLFGIRGQG
jgi:flagellar hook protein FlgE